MILLLALACASEPERPERTSPPPPPPELGTLRIELAPDVVATKAELVDCGDRRRADVVDQRVAFEDVTMGYGCKLYLKGGQPAVYRPVGGGQDLVCSMPDGKTLVCKERVAPPPPPKADTGPLVVELAPEIPAWSVETSECGVRRRSDLKDHRATIPDLPLDGACKLTVKGGEPMSFQPVRGGQLVTCALEKGQFTCRSRPAEAAAEALHVTLARDMDVVDLVEVRCGDVRISAAPKDLEVTMAGIPADTDCELSLKGGPGGTNDDPVRAGQDLVCRWTLDKLWCQERKLPPSKVRGDLHVTFDPPDDIDGADVRCPDENQLSGVSDGRAFFEDIPADQDCWLALLGRAPAKVGPVRGGQSVICRYRDGDTKCEAAP